MSIESKSVRENCSFGYPRSASPELPTYVRSPSARYDLSARPFTISVGLYDLFIHGWCNGKIPRDVLMEEDFSSETS